MKKSLSILLVLALTLALSACVANTGGSADGQNKENPASSPSSSAQSTPSTESSSSQPTSSTTSQPSKTLLTREQAIDLALKEAGVARADVRELEAELDRERGGVVWEVEFETAGYEYAYDIHAETGAVVERDRDRED